MTDLLGENGGKAHCQVSQVTVVLVVKRFGKHVRRSEGKHEVALGQRFHGFPAAFSDRASFPNGANDHARRAASIACLAPAGRLVAHSNRSIV